MARKQKHQSKQQFTYSTDERLIAAMAKRTKANGRNNITDELDDLIKLSERPDLLDMNIMQRSMIERISANIKKLLK